MLLTIVIVRDYREEERMHMDIQNLPHSASEQADGNLTPPADIAADISSRQSRAEMDLQDRISLFNSLFQSATGRVLPPDKVSRFLAKEHASFTGQFHGNETSAKNVREGIVYFRSPSEKKYLTARHSAENNY